MNGLLSDGSLPGMRVHYAEILCQLAEERNICRTELLSASGIRHRQLGHPDNFITLHQFIALCEAVLARCDDDCLGLEYGTRLKFTAHGALSQAAISCDTLEQALYVLIKYFRTRFAYMSLSFFVEEQDAVLQLELRHDTATMHRFNVEVVLATLMEVNYLLFGTRLLDGGRCLVDYPRPTHAERYQSLFGGEVEFAKNVNQLRFRRRFLSLPMSLSNPVARRVAEAQCEEEMRQIEAATSVAGRVLRLLETTRDGRLPGIEEVALHMGVSPRTLRRQLAAEGEGFQNLQERVRQQRALELLLGRSAMTIEQIAEHLGYSDPSNFGRAFRKWQGVSPSVWRKQNQV